MMRTTLSLISLPLLFCCGEPGPQGPQGPEGPAGTQGPPGAAASIDPVLNLITPARAFPDRSVLLQISGAGTHFKADTRVRFDDPELTVGRVTVGSAGYLAAELRIGAKARLGPHDVTVETQAPAGRETPQAVETVELKGSFSVIASLVAEPQGNGSAPQGGLVDFNLRSIDRDSPPAGTATLSGDVRALYLSALGSRAVGYGLVDALATPGGLSLALSFDSGGSRLAYVLDPMDAAAPRATARTPTALTLGTIQSGEKLSAPRTSNLYKLTTEADDQILTLSFSTTGPLAMSTVAGAVAPASGRWSEGQFFYASQNGGMQTALALGGKKGEHYVAVLAASLGGGGDFGYSITARAEAGRSVSLKEGAMSPDTPAMPLGTLTLDAPHASTDAALDSAVDLDHVRFVAKKSGRLFVQAMTPGLNLGSPATVVTLLQGDCLSQIAPPRPVQQEAAVTQDQTYCARISSPIGYVGPYRLLASH
jgi:hypothetical protein